MPIYTTYLANKPKSVTETRFGSWFIYFVMRNRGNNEVAPPEWLLRNVKAGRVTWEKYVLYYSDWLATMLAEEWMEKRAREAKIGNVLLVCFEKDATHCHRRLLAEEISKRFGVEYKGEL